MGHHLSTHRVRRSLLVQGQTSCHGRLLLKEGGNFTISRLNNGRTPRNLKYNMGNSEGLLVASNEKGRYQIHQRLHHVSIQEKPTKQNETTSISYHIGHL